MRHQKREIERSGTSILDIVDQLHASGGTPQARPTPYQLDRFTKIIHTGREGAGRGFANLKPPETNYHPPPL